MRATRAAADAGRPRSLLAAVETIDRENNPALPPDRAPAPPPRPDEARERRSTMSRIRLLRISLGIAILVAAIAIYTPTLLYTSSSEAMLNARFIALGSPIEGRVTKVAAAEGSFVTAGTTLLTVQNPNVDSSHLEELETTRTRTATELAASNQLAATLGEHLKTLDSQLAIYRTAAGARLEFSAGEARAEAVSAAATADQARRNFERKRALVGSNVISASDLDLAQEAVRRADANAERARLGAERMEQELNAAKQGVYIDGDRNDVPYSQQRADEYRVRQAEAVAQSKALTARLAQLDEQTAAEQARVQRLASADVRAPVPGVVWRQLVAHGSTGARNSEMLTLIDCSEIYATATFSGRRFDDLRPGAHATVHLLNSNRDYDGTVIDVRAMERSDAEERFAAPLPRLGDRQILVVVRLDQPGELASEKYCNVGRRVEVRFKDLGGTAASADAR